MGFDLMDFLFMGSEFMYLSLTDSRLIISKVKGIDLIHALFIFSSFDLMQYFFQIGTRGSCSEFI